MTLEKIYKEEIEKSVLATFIIDNQRFFDQDFRASFFTGKNLFIFEAIKNIIKKGSEATLPTIFTELNGAVDMATVSKLIDVPMSHNLEYHFKILQDAKLSRVVYESYGKGVKMAEDGVSPHEIIGEINGLINHVEPSRSRSIEKIAEMVEANIEARVTGKIKNGLNTGISNLDRVTGGFASELVLIAARPGVGKTSLALNFARNLGFHNVPGIIFSLEMSAEQLVERMVCDVGSIDNKWIFKNEASTLKGESRNKFFKKLTTTTSTISALPIEIDDSAQLTMDNIYNRSKKAKAVNDIQYIIIDYVGLIKGWNDEGQGPKAEITRQMKMLSKELDVPVIALCQMNRKIEDRKEKIPKMSDLRDAGSLEQDADIILFPDVPDKDNSTEGDCFSDAIIMVAKNRKGRTGLIEKLKWAGHYFRYFD